MVLMFLVYSFPIAIFFLSLLCIFVTTNSGFLILVNMYICNEKGLNKIQKELSRITITVTLKKRRS